MGAYGSGGGRLASKMDEFHKLDLASFKTAWFERGRRGRVTWSRGGRETGSIGYTLGGDWLELEYVSGREPNRQTVRERFSIAFTEQPFGGTRRWIVCRSCSRRCRVLIGGTYFRCRKCYKATYPSQYENFFVKGLNKAERIRDKLGGEPGFCNPFPAKPKGMHWRTYRHLEQRDWDAVASIDRALNSFLR